MSQQPEETYSLGYLLTKSARAVTQQYTKLAAPHGITASQSGILITLQNEGPLTQVDIAAVLHLDKANTNSMVKKLLEAEFIGSRKVAGDARKTEIFLTASGKKMAKIIHKINYKISSELEKHSANKEELAATRRVLYRILFDINA